MAPLVVANHFPPDAVRSLFLVNGPAGLTCGVRSDVETTASQPAPGVTLPDTALTVSIDTGFGSNLTPITISSAVVYTAAD